MFVKVFFRDEQHLVSYVLFANIYHLELLTNCLCWNITDSVNVKIQEMETRKENHNFLEDKKARHTATELRRLECQEKAAHSVSREPDTCRSC